MKHKLAKGKDFVNRICEAVGLDPARVGRIVIDSSATGPVYLYVLQFGDERLLDPGLFAGIEIVEGENEAAI